MSDQNAERPPAEVWDSADFYDSYVGRWSRLVAGEFLAWLAVPAGGRWLDVGCGTGALSRSILDLAQPATVLGVDPSEHYVVHARARIANPITRFAVGDARALPVADGAFDAAVSGLVLNFVPAADQGQAIAAMARAVRGGGIVAAYVWDYAGGMELIRHFWDAAVLTNPTARDLDEGRRFPLCRPDALATLFRGNGLADVVVRAIDVPTVFRGFDDYWAPFLGGQGPAPGYTMSLREDRRAVLGDLLRSRLPCAPDGSIHLTAGAWAVRGTRAPR